MLGAALKGRPCQQEELSCVHFSCMLSHVAGHRAGLGLQLGQLGAAGEAACLAPASERLLLSLVKQVASKNAGCSKCLLSLIKQVASKNAGCLTLGQDFVVQS